MNAVAVDLPINVMTPFLVYMVAEELGLSGILAVVAAGLVHGMQMRRLQLTSTQTQVVTRSTWTILTSLLNGFVSSYWALSCHRFGKISRVATRLTCPNSS
ncbi:cation:proton antiporter domain-containing protein [Secundilactobacillus kimchicus]|uniref:cation:proton antiporter domain-containing protein n=1 Tax=Secundilactobacillus kimchicus TaxID=528209 RepID=UPI002436B5AF|nr:cation:proton antiporter [Secundilactobacillus kimchicus]